MSFRLDLLGQQFSQHKLLAEVFRSDNDSLRSGRSASAEHQAREKHTRQSCESRELFKRGVQTRLSARLRNNRYVAAGAAQYRFLSTARPSSHDLRREPRPLRVVAVASLANRGLDPQVWPAWPRELLPPGSRSCSPWPGRGR